MKKPLTALLLAALSVAASADDLRLAPYGTAKTFDFRILAADGTFVTNATDAGTDVTLTCDDGTPATATNDFVDEGSHYSIALTATELQCARLVVDVADATPNGFIIETYGNASAQHVAFAANVTQYGGTAGTFASGRPEVNTTHAAGTAWNSGAIGANTLAADTITAAKAAADLTTELQSGLATASALTTVGTNVSTLLEALVVLGAEQTADSGTTTTIVDAALTQGTDGWFNGMAVHFTSGTLLGQASCVTGFTASSDTVTFSPAVTTAVTTHTYYLLPDAECATGDAFGRIGVAGAGLTNIDLPNQTMDITGTLSGSVGSVTGAVGSVTGSVGSIASGGISDASFATTTGELKALGITRQGTAQGATSTTVTLDASAPFGDNTNIGSTLWVKGSTNGNYWQPCSVTAYVASTKVATVSCPSGFVTPTGTITYQLFGTASGGGDVNVTTIEGTDATTVLGTAQTGDAYARLGAPAGASVSADIAAVKSDSAAILVDTADMQPKLGTYSDLGSGATLAGNLEDMRDDGTAVYSRTTDSLQAIRDRGDAAWTGASTNITQIEGTDATDQIDARVQAQLQLYRLDELVAADSDIDGAAPPTVGSVFHELLTSSAASFTFDQTTDSLEAIRNNLAGGAADWTADERTAIKAILGVDGTATPADPATGILNTIRNYVDTEVATLVTNVGTPSNLGSGASLAANLVDVEAQTDDIGVAGAGLSAVDDAVMTRLGAPAGASMSADVAAVKADTAATLVDTAEIGVAGAGLTAADDAVIAAIAALNNLSANQVRDLVIEDQGGGVSLGCALAVLLAYASGDIATTGTTTTYEEPSGTETRTTGTVASAGNRTATITCPTY